MNRTALYAATLAGILSATALAQTPAPQTQPKDPNATQSSTPQQQPRDPSSTAGRPDASYKNPSGQDTKTDAASRPHQDKGHDHPGDRNKVDPTPSAGPQGDQREYTGASGKKQNSETACETPTNAPREGQAANPGAPHNAPECLGNKQDADRSQSRRAQVPPGATAPVPK
jgi:hypothetical protein